MIRSNVYNYVKEMDIYICSNVRDINIFLSKECMYCTFKEATHLFHLICPTSIFRNYQFHLPDCWKTTTITPMFKSGNIYKEVANYRPISLLSVVGKIIDKLTLTRIYQHDNISNQLCNNQCGFQPRGHKLQNS